MKGISEAFRNAANAARTDRQIICDVFGITYAQSYRSDFANKPTPKRRSKRNRRQMYEHVRFSASHTHVGKLSNRLFA